VLVDTELLGKLLYRNRSQHRGGRAFQQIIGLNRMLRRAVESALPATLTRLAGCLPHTKALSSLHRAEIPSFKIFRFVLIKLLGAAALHQAIGDQCRRIFRSTCGDFAAALFMPFNLICASMASRLAELSKRALAAIITVYQVPPLPSPPLRPSRPVSLHAAPAVPPAILAAAGFHELHAAHAMRLRDWHIESALVCMTHPWSPRFDGPPGSLHVHHLVHLPGGLGQVPGQKEEEVSGRQAARWSHPQAMERTGHPCEYCSLVSAAP